MPEIIPHADERHEQGYPEKAVTDADQKIGDARSKQSQSHEQRFLTDDIHQHSGWNVNQQVGSHSDRNQEARLAVSEPQLFNQVRQKKIKGSGTPMGEGVAQGDEPKQRVCLS